VGNVGLAESNTHIDIDTNNLKVLEMNDGGMGSLYFVSDKNEKAKRIFGKTIVEKLFFDVDKVEISITLNVDTNGDLFELDIWRVDFEPLKLLPTCEKLKL
jgi:hypothetical protein